MRGLCVVSVLFVCLRSVCVLQVSYEDVARLGLARRMDGGVWAWLGSEAAEASVRIEAKG